jgi:hypothetical protein
MPLLFVLVMCLLGIGIAMFRRSPQAFLDGPSEDMPTRLLRWAAGLLSPQRGEWGQAMLGEHLLRGHRHDPRGMGEAGTGDRGTARRGGSRHAVGP